MKILIMGAGAMGSYLGSKLVQAGENVAFCARGPHLRALKTQGLQVKSFRGNFHLAQLKATNYPEEYAPYDLILFCVKAYDTDHAIEMLETWKCLGTDGVILTLQNGIENEEALVEHFGKENVLSGLVRVGAELIAPGHVHHVTGGKIDFGELDGQITQRTKAIEDVFRRAEILGTCALNIRTLKWEKLLWNVAFNTVATLTRCTVGEILDDGDALVLIRKLMFEALRVAQADGAKLHSDVVRYYIEEYSEKLRLLKTSTQQDFEHGNRLEYDALTGAVIRRAYRWGVPVPTLETVHSLIQALDKSNRARNQNKK